MITLQTFKGKRALVLLAWLSCLYLAGGEGATVRFSRDFAALEGYVKPVEQPARLELCLNGSWQFQPVEIPAGWRKNQGVPPQLSSPTTHWEATPIKIPSPWNANTYGCGREVGAGTEHPYWPDSVWYPSYPAAWDGVQMGWLRRTFRVPADWGDKRVLLHFEAVAGGCTVLINGQPAGEHFENFLPFELDVTGLVKRGEENELLVGVRHPHLYDKTDSAYPHEARTYADGSTLDGIVGIWQDVYLLGEPAVRVADVFVQPWLDRGELLVETTLRNDTDQAQAVTLSGDCRPWINEAGKDVLSAPEPKWSLGKAVLSVSGQEAQVPAKSSVTVSLRAPVQGELKTWSPDQPNLYGLVLSVSVDGKVMDTRYQRFGWRQFKIRGGDLLLNGRKIQIAADILHPFGMVVQSRRNAYAWYQMIKDVGGNGVRLHAQPWPSYYQDLADEMGLLVLAEDGLFGSSLALNFTDPVSWQRFAEHYDAMVRRDRNHPSVFGWSFGNELFAIFDYNKMTAADCDKYYAKLTELGRRSFRLDPTREWISCDGDQDLRGTIPVWSKHLGHGLHLDALPAHLDKPLMVGESGGTYYATPSQLAEFNGDRAYESYAGRNEALGIDVYQNIVQMAQPRLAYYSASELVWFGLEHLPLGYSDFTRLPTLRDGIFFKPFEEGKPGAQPERIPPYTSTLNPGYDPALPLYKPLAMFDAMKAALAPGGPQPSPWDHKTTSPPRSAAPAPAAITSVGFLGDQAGSLFSKLAALGTPLVDKSDAAIGMLVIDGETLTPAQAEAAKPGLESLLAQGGLALVCFHRPDAPTEAANRLLPAAITLTSRTATALEPGQEDSLSSRFTLPDLYFAENKRDRLVLKAGLDGEFVKQGTVIFKASNTDWSQFNNVREDAKCAAVVLYEHLVKPSGAALVSLKQGRGSLLVSALDYQPGDPAYVKLWQSLLGGLGVKLGELHSNWVLPIAPVKAVAWRYTTNQPAAGWEKPGFDDSRWPTAEAGFGSDVPNNKTRTPWSNDDIWLRKRFDLSLADPSPLKLVIYHDEDVEVYLNGELAFAAPGFIVNYQEVPLPEAVVGRLQAAGNEISVHCHQTTGGQYIDAGLVRGTMILNDSAESEHDLLLNGPK
jgi:beta-galactosidase